MDVKLLRLTFVNLFLNQSSLFRIDNLTDYWIISEGVYVDLFLEEENLLISTQTMVPIFLEHITN